jgi:hypothetical protein
MTLAADDKYGWTVLCYCLCIFFIIVFAAYGTIYVVLMGKKVKVRILQLRPPGGSGSAAPFAK